jgi:hypothetical protein
MKKHILLILLSVSSLGTIQAEITWTLSDDGTLTISGTDMPNYSSNSSPWYSQRDKIKKIVIENGVTNIGNSAFYDCFNLASISIPNSVTRIGSNAFNGTKWYNEQPEGLVYAGLVLYKYKGYMSPRTNIVIKEGIKGITASAFSNCPLSSVTIPNSVTSIGSSAFYGCSGLTTITIPNSVTSIESGVFSCSGLISITIPNSVTSIGGSAFHDCYDLASISIPNSVTSIGEAAFGYCPSLTSITIPNSVTSIGDYAFKECFNLNSITIPKSVTSIGRFVFSSCSSLKSIIVENGNNKYDSRNNCNAIIETETNTLLMGCKNTIIPNSVTTIGNDAFSFCSGLTSITIPNSVTSIGASAFSGCEWLTSVTIPNSVTNIGQSAFDNCPSLTSITIPNSVNHIGVSAFSGSGLTSISIPNSVMSIESYAFMGCYGLTSVAISNSVTNIGDYAFAYCTGLSSIVCEAETPPVCKDFVFDGVSESIPVDVPANSLEAYKAAKEWKNFTNIQAIIDNQAIANAVIEKINTIGKVEYTDACKSKIDDASSAYNALTADQKSLVTNLDVLTTAQQTYDNLKTAAEKLAADKAKADPVITKINAIGKVEYTDACKAKIDDASNAYNALTADQKALVSNLDVLTTAEQTYDNLKAAAEKLAADKAKADVVIAKINAIGKVEYTYACKDKIDDANNAYNDLTADQKALVSNLDVLTTAKQTYDNLKTAAEKLAADKAKAEPVIAKINAIGKVEYTDACKNKIDEANNAYNALTADQKALVSNLDVLTTAQQTYESLKAAAEKLAADKAAFDQYKSEQKAIIEALIKEDDSDAVKDIIKKAISDIDALGYEEAISLDDNKVNINSFVTSVNEAVEKQRAEDQKTTGIEELEFAEKANIYDLNGRKITNSMLKSGLYIRNGKKVVVK